MDKIINELREYAPILSLLFGSGILISLFKFIKGKISNNRVSFETCEQIKKDLEYATPIEIFNYRINIWIF